MNKRFRNTKKYLDTKLTKDFLIKEYIHKQKTMVQISKEINCSDDTVGNYLKKFKFKIRLLSESKKLNYYNNSKLTKEILEKEYLINKKTQVQIAKKYKISCASVCRHIKYYKIPCRSRSEMYSGEGNPMFGKERPDMEGSNNPNWNSELIKCPVCNKEFYCHKSRIKLTKNICCSHICAGKLKTILFRKDDSLYPLGWTKTFKEQIRYRDGYKCQLCGCSEVENSRKLSVHHIDYNKNNILPDNLISLCIHCHGKTNTHRTYWKKYFKENKYGHISNQ